MKTIKNYNPNLYISLKDLEMIASMPSYTVETVINAIGKSIRGDTSYTFPNKLNQLAYDALMKFIPDSVQRYEKYLIEKCGYTEEDIEEYHREQHQLIEEEE